MPRKTLYILSEGQTRAIVGRLVSVGKSLRKIIKRDTGLVALNVAKTTFLDTNIYLHYQFFDQVNWLEVLKASEVMIVVPPVTVRELNKHKELHPQQRVKKRAAKVLKKLASLRESDCQANIPDNVEMRFEDRDPMVNFAKFQLDKSIQDDQLIASIIMFRKEHKAEVILVTADEGLLLKTKAERQGIPTIRMPDNLKLAEEPDSNQIYLRKLEQKVRAHEIKMPQISLVFADGNQHATFGLLHPVKLTTEEIASKQKLLEQRYPKMEQESKQTSVLPEHLASAAGAYAKLLKAMGNIWLLENIEEYNANLDKYYQAYYEYLLKFLWYANLGRRTVKLSIFAANDGGAPAEDVNVFLHFPNGFKLTDERGFPNAPETPEPPAKPRTQMQRLLESMSSPLGSMPLSISRMPRPLLPPPNVSAPNIKNTGSYNVDFHIQRLKHKLSEPVDPLYVIFESFENARSFQIDYQLLAANIPDEVIGQLHVIIGKGH